MIVTVVRICEKSIRKLKQMFESAVNYEIVPAIGLILISRSEHSFFGLGPINYFASISSVFNLYISITKENLVRL